MTYIGRYLSKGSSLWDSCAILTTVTEKELHCQVEMYGNM